jgi:hypothetical protein
VLRDGNFARRIHPAAQSAIGEQQWVTGFHRVCVKCGRMVDSTDYGRPERKKPSLHGRKFNPNPKFLGTAEAYFVCHIGPIFQISR